MDVSDFESVLRTEPPIAHVTATGELDAFTSRELSRQVNRAFDAGCTTFRLHLGGLTFIDAAGIGLLVRLRVTAMEVGGALELVEVSQCVRRLCTILELGPVLGLDPSTPGSRRRVIA
jgi:anti-sigma B factor antagonist